MKYFLSDRCAGKCLRLVPPSSPSMALLKGKEVVQFIPREQIEGRSVEEIVDDLLIGFNDHC